MRNIISFENFINESRLAKMIPIFANHPGWRLNDSCEKKDGNINFSFSNDYFEVCAEYCDHNDTYIVSFKEIGKNLIPSNKKYKVEGLEFKDVQKNMSDMMAFLEQYSK